MQHATFTTEQVAALVSASTHPLGEVPQPVDGLTERGLTFEHTLIEGVGHQRTHWLTPRGWEAAALHWDGPEAVTMPKEAATLAKDLRNEHDRLSGRYRTRGLTTFAVLLLGADNALKYGHRYLVEPRPPWRTLEHRVDRTVLSEVINEMLKPVNGGVDILAGGGYEDAARELIAQVVIHLPDEIEALSLAQDADMPEAMERRARRGQG